MIDYAVARLCAEDLLPSAIFRRISDHATFLGHVAGYTVMDDADLLRVTEVCLRNLDRLDSDGLTPDARLRLVLVPELWERLRPGSRAVLRRISSSLAEYHWDDRSSFFSRLLSLEQRSRLREASDCLRDDVERTAIVDATALVEQVRFALAGSRAADRWSPADCVYEPGFTYRLVPAIAWRVLMRGRACTDVEGGSR